MDKRERKEWFRLLIYFIVCLFALVGLEDFFRYLGS
jgi:hypothetical protein